MKYSGDGWVIGQLVYWLTSAILFWPRNHDLAHSHSHSLLIVLLLLPLSVSVNYKTLKRKKRASEIVIDWLKILSKNTNPSFNYNSTLPWWMNVTAVIWASPYCHYISQSQYPLVKPGFYLFLYTTVMFILKTATYTWVCRFCIDIQKKQSIFSVNEVHIRMYHHKSYISTTLIYIF